MYYRTFELNEKLYFHYKGFERIENMDLFPELKCLYWEGNGVSNIEGLDNCQQLLALYIQENAIKKISGLDMLHRLHTLQLSDNLIAKIENLGNCVALDSLYLKNNRIGMGGLSDFEGLLEVPSLACLDIQGNKVNDPEVLDDILVKMPNMKVLYLQNNGISKSGNTIKNYRKTVIAKIKTLRYLDDRPVFDEDRRHAEAFNQGGIDAERAERDLMKKEKNDAHHEYHRRFKEMMREAREEKRKEVEAKSKLEAEARGETWEAPIPTENKENSEPFWRNATKEVPHAPAEVKEEKKEEPQVYEVTEDDKPPALE